MGFSDSEEFSFDKLLNEYPKISIVGLDASHRGIEDLVISQPMPYIRKVFYWNSEDPDFTAQSRQAVSNFVNMCPNVEVLVVDDNCDQITSFQFETCEVRAMSYYNIWTEFFQS